MPGKLPTLPRARAAFPPIATVGAGTAVYMQSGKAPTLLGSCSMYVRCSSTSSRLLALVCAWEPRGKQTLQREQSVCNCHVGRAAATTNTGPSQCAAAPAAGLLHAAYSTLSARSISANLADTAAIARRGTRAASALSSATSFSCFFSSSSRVCGAERWCRWRRVGRAAQKIVH